MQTNFSNTIPYVYKTEFLGWKSPWTKTESYPNISCRISTNGRWNVSTYLPKTNHPQKIPTTFFFVAVARVSLDRRLGCLEPNLPKDSESQKIIDSINTFFWNVAEVELKMPVWRIYKNKTFRDYIGALENFRT